VQHLELVEQFLTQTNKLKRMQLLQKLAQANQNIDRTGAIASNECAVVLELIKKDNSIYFYSNSNILFGLLLAFAFEYNQTGINLDTYLTQNNLQSFLTFDKKKAILKLMEQI
jgi:hypothetical protein